MTMKSLIALSIILFSTFSQANRLAQYPTLAGRLAVFIRLSDQLHELEKNSFELRQRPSINEHVEEINPHEYYVYLTFRDQLKRLPPCSVRSKVILVSDPRGGSRMELSEMELACAVGNPTLIPKK